METGRMEKGCAILSPTLELAKAPQIYICLIQGSEEIITKAFYSIADHPEFDLFVDAFYLMCLSFNNCFLQLGKNSIHTVYFIFNYK